ncbi:MAG: metal ABC transporter substrate-binding protein [Nocardioides sp.]
MRRIPALLLAVGLLAGCSAQATPSADGRVRVAAAFYPLAWVSSQVAPGAEVTDLTRPGVEPHDIELTFAQTVALARADVVVHEQGFQAAVDEGVANDAEGTVIDAGAVAGLKPFADDPGQIDPHFWQDPLKLAAVGDAVAAALARSDPAHAASYLAHAARLRRELTALDGDYRRGLAYCRLHTIVSSHDAFGYLSRYGVHVVSIAGLSPDAEPTPAVLSGLHDLIRREGITTVFSERLVSPKIADTLAHDVGVRSRVLDPVEGLSSETSHDTYLTLMRANLQALEEANRCTPSS